MKVKDIITTPVATVTPDSDVATARDIMTFRKIGSLPVVKMDGEKAIVEGIVSTHDLNGVYDDTVKIAQVMTTKIYAVTPDTSLKRAAEVMIDKKIHHLIVLKEGAEELVGIISALDFVYLVATDQLQ